MEKKIVLVSGGFDPLHSGHLAYFEATKKYGILPADIQPNLLYCDVKYTSPSVVRINPKLFYKKFGGSHTKNDQTF